MSQTTTQTRQSSAADNSNARTITSNSRQESSSFDTIGIALGSPTHPDQFFPQPLRVPNSDNMSSTSPATVPLADAYAPKPKKWGFLSRSKSKHVVVGNDQDARRAAEGQNTPDSTSPNLHIASFSPSRGFSLRRKTKTPKTPADSNQGFPALHGEYHITAAEDRRATAHNGQQNNFSRPGPPKPPLLDVEIPTIKMERYSVMFSGLLPHQKEASSSLLARRQATMAKLRAIEETMDDGSAKQDIPPVPELPSNPPRKRSHTYPTPPPSSTLDEKLSGQPGRRPPSNKPYQAEDLKPQPLVKQPVSDFKPPEHAQTPPNVQSPENGRTPRSGGSDEGRRLLISKFHPTVSSPEPTVSPPWDESKIRRYTEHLDSVGGVLRSSRARAGSMAAQKTTAPMKLPARSTSLRQPEYNLEAKYSSDDVYEVSIARQISISRDQRKLLEPLYEDKKQGGLRPPNYKHAANKVSIDASKRLVETKSATPRVIHPGYDNVSVRDIHRRSEQVVLEGV